VSDINNLTIGGRLTRDVELRYTPTGTAVANFSIASNGYKEGDVCFIECVAWGKQAEALSKHRGKGDGITVVGKLELDRWEKDGQKHQRHKINVRDWHFAGGEPKRQSDGWAPESRPASGTKPIPTYDDDPTPF